MLGRLIKLRTLIDSRGGLAFAESHHDVPFEIKRVYYIFNLDQERKRGEHAHKKLKQLMICVKGSCKVLLRDADSSFEHHLKEPTVGLLVEEPLWREMYGFSEDCVFLVLANEYYDESDYIRDYEEYVNFMKIDENL